MNKIILFAVVVSCSVDERIEDEAAEQEVNFKLSLDLRPAGEESNSQQIALGKKFHAEARLIYKTRDDRENAKDNKLGSLYDRRISLSLDNSVPGANLEGDKVADTETYGANPDEGSAEFRELSIDKAGRHVIVANAEIEGQKLTASQEIEIIAPLTVQFSKNSQLRVGEAFAINLQRAYPQIEGKVTISVPNFDGLLRWNKAGLSELIDKPQTELTFNELFFAKQLPAGDREMLVRIGEDNGYEEKRIKLPPLKPAIGQVTVADHRYDRSRNVWELTIDNLSAATACINDCQVIAFAHGDSTNSNLYLATEVAVASPGPTVLRLSKPCSANQESYTLGIKLSQAGKNYYFGYPNRNCN